MENVNLLYRPYATNYYFSLALLGIGFAFSVMIGYSLSNPGWYLLIPVLFVLTCLALAKFLYDTSMISVLLETDGLRIVCKRNTTAQYYAWPDIQHMVQARSKRGHAIIVLSKEELSKNQLERCVKQSTNLSSPCIEENVVLRIDPLQNTTQLLNYLKQLLETTSSK